MSLIVKFSPSLYDRDTDDESEIKATNEVPPDAKLPPLSRSRQVTGDINNDGWESRKISQDGVSDDVVPLAAVSAV